MSTHRELWLGWKPWWIRVLLPSLGSSRRRRSLKLEDLDTFLLYILPRKLAVVVAGSGRVFIAHSTPFPWSIEGGTFDVLRLEIRG